MRRAAALCAIVAVAAAPGARAIRSIELTSAFGTRWAWRITATQAPDMDDPIMGDGGQVPGAITLCLARVAGGPCDPAVATMLRWSGGGDDHDQPHELHRLEIVHPAPGRASLLIQAASLRGVNGNQRVGTDLYAYDRTLDRFRRVYHRQVGRNTNDEVRYVGSGPLAGAVIAAEPTADAPFGYWITVDRPAGSGDYLPVLRYRSATRYGDANPLAVIDSEMPMIRHRLGERGWPLPASRPTCPRPRVVRGELWCGTPSTH